MTGVMGASVFMTLPMVIIMIAPYLIEKDKNRELFFVSANFLDTLGEVCAFFVH